MENQILKYGFTTCEITILENDDPGGVFEFSSSSRGPYSIKVANRVMSLEHYRQRSSNRVLEKNEFEFYFFAGRGVC